MKKVLTYTLNGCIIISRKHPTGTLKGEKIMKLTLVERKVEYFGSNECKFYFTTESGERYYWRTKSNKAFDELQRGMTIEAKFKETGRKYTDEHYRTWFEIKNIRW